jgi:hypothetical protein
MEKTQKRSERKEKGKEEVMSESTKRVSGRQTAGQAVIQFLKRKGALDEEHAVGYDQLKNIKLTTKDDLEMFKAYLKADKDNWLK